MSIKTLVINPGSTSTKVGVFEDETLLFEETLRHPTEEIAKYASVIDQKDFRKEIILDFLKEKDCDPKSLDVIVGRGGLLKPIPGGTYTVSDALLADLVKGVQGQHASNLGGILAREIGDKLGVPSYIVDPVVVDELTDKARLSGMPELPRRSIFHALNQKAVARRYAKEHGTRYEDLNLIVIHMGGGVSVGAHDHGKVVDVNNILDGEGCFSPERSGTVPVGDLVKMCFSGKYTQQEIYKKICGNGGFNRPRGGKAGQGGQRRGPAGAGRLLLPDRQGRRRHGRRAVRQGGPDHPDRRHRLQPLHPRDPGKAPGLHRPHHRLPRRGRAAGPVPGRAARGHRRRKSQRVLRFDPRPEFRLRAFCFDRGCPVRYTRVYLRSQKC